MQNVDLKSLQVFASLMKECNVTRTAEMLGITQSAVSHTLKRLRNLLDDPLFVSSGRGIVPTPRALELAAPLELALQAVHALVQPADAFDPATHDGVFTVATTDYIGFILLSDLLKHLSLSAPDVALNILPLHPKDDLAALSNYEIDLILWNEETAPANFFVRHLFTDRLKAIVRKGHPAINGSLSLEQFRAAKHLRISSNYGAVKENVDRYYELHGTHLKTSVTVPHFLLAHRIVAESDLIGNIGELTARKLGRELPLQVLEPPMQEKGFSVSMVWHERRHADPAHRWFRGEIAAVAEAIRLAPVV